MYSDIQDFQSSAVVNKTTANARHLGEVGWIPGTGRFPGGENGSLPQCS